MPVLSRPFAPQPQEQLEGVSTWNEAMEASVDETLATGPSGGAWNSLRLWGTENLGFDTSPVPMFGPAAMNPFARNWAKSPKVNPEDAQQRVKDAGLEGQVPLDQYPDGIRLATLNLLIDLNQQKVRRQTLTSQYDGFAPQVTGMLVGSLMDPINIATAFVPVIGEARYAQLLKQAGGVIGRTGVRVGVGAVEGAVGSALVEPAIYAGQQQWRNDYDAYDSMLNIAGGAAFGSLLHAGAGLARDAFGNPIPEVQEQVITPQRQVFADPDLVASEAFKAKARAMGVSEQVAQQLSPKAARDDVTGYFDGRQSGVKAQTVERAIQHVARSGEPGYYVSADISNLGGLNAHVGNVAEAANVYFRGLTDILESELRKTGADVVPMRTGGDELGAVVINADARAIEQAMRAVDDRVNQYVRDRGLADVPHPKRSNEKGVGLHAGVSPIGKGLTVDAILARADDGVNASKLGLKHVTRRTTGEAGIVPSRGQSEGAGGGDAAADAGIRPELRQFIAGLDPDTQGAALRHAIAQAVDGRPIDVTPAMLADPQFNASPEAYREAVQRATRNATQVDGANERAARDAETFVARSESDALSFAKEQLAEEQQRVKASGGEPESVDDDLKLTTDAVKAATMCLMRSNA